MCRGTEFSVGEIGYGGPLCQVCVNINNTYYSKKSNKTCNICHDLPIEIFILVCILFFTIIFYLILVK